MENKTKTFSWIFLTKALFSLFKGSAGLIVLIVCLEVVSCVLDGLGMSYFIPLLQAFGISDSAVMQNGDNWLLDMVSKPLKIFPSHSLLYVVLAIVILITVFKNAITYYKETKAIWFENRVLTDLRKRLFAQVILAPLSYFNELRFGNVVNCIQNQTQEVSFAARILIRFFSEIIMMSVLLGFMFVLSAKLTIVTILALFIVSASLHRLQKSMRKISFEFVSSNNKFNGVLLEALNNMRLIKAYTAEKHECSKFDSAAEGVGSAIYHRTRKSLLAPPVIETLFVVVLAVILSMGNAMLASYGKAKTAVLIIFVVALYRLLGTIRDFNVDRIKLVGKVGPMQMIFSMIHDEHIKAKSIEGPLVFTELKDAIRFENISFQYTTDRKILDGFNLIINKKETIGIIGASAAGKSTVVNLLMRFYDPLEGSISIDGVDIKKFTVKNLRERMGFVPQETYLFNATVEDNIRYGRDGALTEDVVAAARTAGAHDFISSMPDGYKTIIGEKGIKISGGQRQKIALARAILHKPDILILDEATSALDNISEKDIQETIKSLGHVCTKIIIAHRLSTVKDADKIIVLDGGRVIEEGRHDELISRKGAYSKLYHAT